MTKRELISKIEALLDDAYAVAQSDSSASNSSAGSGAANARTQSNTEQASGTESVFKNVSQKTDSDINLEEAWGANVKRTYDVHQTYDFETQAQMRTHFNTMITQQQNHLAALNQMSLQAIANNQNQSNLNNLLGIDRAWNVNETDAFSVLLNKVVSEAVKAEMANLKG